MKWFNEYQVGALVACFINAIIVPKIYTVFIWMVVFWVMNIIFAWWNKYEIQY